jgi:hypothetical protein
MLKIDRNFFSSKCDNSYTIQKPMSNLVDLCCFKKFYTFIWQLFNSPVGYAMTNSPIERYNRTIKDSFTIRVKHHLKTAIQVFQEVVSYESTHCKEFRTEVRVRKYMRVQAKSTVLKKQLIATNSESEFLYRHFNSKLGFARINLISKTCTCHKFLDTAVKTAPTERRSARSKK